MHGYSQVFVSTNSGNENFVFTTRNNKEEIKPNQSPRAAS